jgi:hypothetical protein
MFLRYQDWSSMLVCSGVDEHFRLSRDFGNRTISYTRFDLKLSGVAYSFQF